MAIATGIFLFIGFHVALLFPATGLLFTALLLVVLSGGPSLDSGVSIGARAAAAAILLAAVCRSDLRPPNDSPRVLPVLRTFLFALGVALASLGILHGDWNSVVNAALGASLLILLVKTFERTGSSSGFAVWLALGATLGTSLLMGLVSPEVAIEGERLRGVTENANLLGFLAFLFIAVSMDTLRPGSVRVVATGLGMLALAWTGSRTSAIAVAVYLLWAAWGRQMWAQRILALGVVLGLVAALLVPHAAHDAVALFVDRSFDTRSSSLRYALQVLEQSPAVGVGLQNLETMVASTPLRLVAAGGLFGALLGVVLYWSFVRLGRGVGRGTQALVAGAAVHSLGEAWLVSTSGPMVVMFVAAFVVSYRAADADECPMVGPPEREWRHV